MSDLLTHLEVIRDHLRHPCAGCVSRSECRPLSPDPQLVGAECPARDALASLAYVVGSLCSAIAGFFGMNVSLPLAGLPAAFWIIAGLSLVISATAAIILTVRKLM